MSPSATSTRQASAAWGCLPDTPTGLVPWSPDRAVASTERALSSWMVKAHSRHPPVRCAGRGTRRDTGLSSAQELGHELPLQALVEDLNPRERSRETRSFPPVPPWIHPVKMLAPGSATAVTIWWSWEGRLLGKAARVALSPGQDAVVCQVVNDLVFWRNRLESVAVVSHAMLCRSPSELTRRHPEAACWGQRPEAAN